MASPEKIRKAFERNKKVLELRPSKGPYTAKTKITVTNGTTCQIKSGSKELVCDVGTEVGGNDAGPGPGILERGALGSCLAIGYATWTAHMEIPVDSIAVEIETNIDARGQFGINDIMPGFKELKYTVHISSPASRGKLQELIETADAHSPVLDDFRRPIPIKREIDINHTVENTS